MPKRLEAFVQMANDTAEQMAAATEIPPQSYYRNQVAIRVSREMLVAMGEVEPTPEERAEMDKQAAESNARRRESWRIYDAARPALDAITDPVARAVLDLHSSETIEAPRCDGCDIEGYECERPEWPCRTVQAVAGHYGIDLPSAWDLWRRPE